MPSAFADSAHRSAESSTPLAGRPASTPASLPSSGEVGASSAPASTTPGVASMARTSVRPMRPPAPATISRMSDMAHSPRKQSLRYSPRDRPCQYRQRLLRLRPVVALDDNKIGERVRLPHLDVGLVLRRIVA